MKRQLPIALAILAACTWGCSKPAAPPAGTGTPGAGTPAAVSTGAPATTPSAAAASVPSGWTENTSTDGKMHVALPEKWVIADPKNEKFQELLKELVKTNPTVAAAMQGNNTYYFMALDSESKDGFSDNVNVVKKEVPQTFPMTDETVNLIKTELSKALPLQGELTADLVEVPFGKAIHYEGTLHFNGPKGGGFETYAIGYMLFKGTDLYTVTFSTSPKRKDGFRDVAKQAMESFKVD